MRGRSIALIGSFRQHYESVLAVCKKIRDAGIEITSPKGAPIVEPGIPFVRFTSDPDPRDDESIQSLAMHRILRAELTYVIAPQGYVGRTTCYEIGRILQAQHPLYFTAPPSDLPILIPASHILSPDELIERIENPNWTPEWLYHRLDAQSATLEQQLILGNYVLD